MPRGRASYTLRMQTLRDAAISIVRTLRNAGHVAYLAGGCVRDRLLGIEPKDYDVATDATPDVVKRLLRGARLVGEAFGVVMVPVRTGRGASGSVRGFIEVATFRMEWGYTDGRRPDRVAFTDAQHDAQRRDFTINGLFEDPLDDNRHEGTQRESHEGRIIDYVGGVRDLEARIIRAIGDPSDRFGEDYLRMLRAVRFAARLGFEIESATARAIRNNARYLGQISRERIGQEVQAMLEGPDPARAATMIQELHLDAATLNEDHSAADLPTIRAIGRRTYATMLAAWLVDRHPNLDEATRPGLVRRWRRALCLSNDQCEALSATLAVAVALEGWPAMGVAQRKRLLGRAHAAEGRALFDAIRRDPVGQRSLDRDIDALSRDGVGIAPPPLVGGDDLIALGLTPGPSFKRILDDLYDAQLEGRVTTRDQALAGLASRHAG